MGGFAVWDCLCRYPGKFAAAVVLCGGGDPKAINPEVAKVPLWDFHGIDDNDVKFSRSQEMIDALRNAGAKPHFTKYNGLHHWIWGCAYADKDLLPWLFSQRRGQPDQFPHIDSDTPIEVH